MRESRAVCLVCRAVAAGKRPCLARSRPATATASFSSAAGDAAGTLLNHDEAPGTRPPRPAAARSSAVVPLGSAASSGSMAIFESVVKGQQKAHSAKSRRSGPELSLHVYQQLAQLKLLLKRYPETAVESFKLFKDSIYPQIIDANHIPGIFRREIQDLLDKTLVAVATECDSLAFPPLMVVTQIALKLGMLKPKLWAEAAQQILLHAVSVDTDPQSYDRIEYYEGALGMKNRLIYSLTQSWKLLSLPKELLAVIPPLSDPGRIHFNLPTLTDTKLQKHLKQQNLHLALCTLFPSFVPNQLRTVTPVLVATFAVLNDINVCPHKLRRDAMPLLAPIAGMLSSTSLGQLQNTTELPRGLSDYLKGRWPTIRDQLKGTEKSTYGPAGNTSFERLDMDGSDSRAVKLLHKDLTAALHKKDLGAVEQVWLEFYGTGHPPSETTVKMMKQNTSLFNQLMTAFTALHQPQRAIEVWNTMISIGMTPDTKSYTAMMSGFKRARNLVGVENVWEKLVASGLKLDVPAWTTRIDGLIACGKPEAGLRALDEMARRWHAYSVDRKEEASRLAVKPTVAPVNAALAGLLRINGLAAAQKLLAWAERNDISPDIITYNTLLRTLIREGTSGADAVFSMMKQQGIEPDDATVTLIMDALAPSLHGLGPEEHLTQVRHILDIIDKSSSAKNLHAYAKLLHLLLVNGNGNEDMGVKEVMSHIWQQGLEPSQFIYTILADHYLARDPPEMNLVRSLIENHRLFERSVVDHIFWERVINGYILVQDLDGALDILNRLGSTKFVTMTTLTKLLQAFVATSRMDVAAKLVVRVRVDRLPTSDDRDPRFLKHSFFDLAREFGLYRWEKEYFKPGTGSQGQIY